MIAFQLNIVIHRALLSTMGISRKELERNREFFYKILKTKKNIQLEDIILQAKLTELKALQGVVKGVLKYAIPLTKSQTHRLQPNRINVRKFAMTKCLNKASLQNSLKPIVPSLRTLVKPLFPNCRQPRLINPPPPTEDTSDVPPQVQLNETPFEKKNEENDDTNSKSVLPNQSEAAQSQVYNFDNKSDTRESDINTDDESLESPNSATASDSSNLNSPKFEPVSESD